MIPVSAEPPPTVVPPLADRVLTTFVVATSWFLFVILLADSAGRLGITPATLAIALVVGILASAAVLLPRRFADRAPVAVRGLGVVIVAGAAASILVPTQDRIAALAIAAMGLVLALDTIGTVRRASSRRA